MKEAIPSACLHGIRNKLRPGAIFATTVANKNCILNEVQFRNAAVVAPERLTGRLRDRCKNYSVGSEGLKKRPCEQASNAEPQRGQQNVYLPQFIYVRGTRGGGFFPKKAQPEPVRHPGVPDLHPSS